MNADALLKAGADQRKFPRVAWDFVVQVRSNSVDEFRATHAKNISVGGMFIANDATDPPAAASKRPVGSDVYFQFTVKDGGTLIEGLGRVVHASDKGIGVEFVSVLEPSRSIIQALVESRLAVGPPLP